MPVETSITTQNIDQITTPTGNLYESISVISKRARQVASNMKRELDSKLTEFATTVDNLEEVFENREQIAISQFYEQLPKSTIVAMKEFLEGKLVYRNRTEPVQDVMP